MNNHQAQLENYYEDLDMLNDWMRRHPEAKQCTQCKVIKPILEFHRDASRKDGHRAQCRACRNPAQRAYQQQPEVQKARQIWQREYERTYERPDRDPIKVSAWIIVTLAVKKGTLEKVSTLQCNQCSRPARDYHHTDYSQPLQVTPLCRTCHNRIHHAKEVT